ncbi:hypothetical protein [Microbacterium sp. NPDC058345]|uniref:hypothetical protein n=1 Tax=Microbacterium sp. NPDC058345 TaxID=3346455 RepID=UPI00365CC61A
MAPLLIWTQLAATLNDEYGYRRRGRDQRARTAVVALILTVMVGALALLVVGVDVPLAARLVPGALAFAVFGALSWDEWRRATSEPVERARQPFDLGARLTTAGIGAALAATAVCVTATDELLAAVVTLLVMLAITVWLTVSIATGGNRVALSWGPLLWTAFAAASASIVILLILARFTDLPLWSAGSVAGVLIALVFAIAAVSGRDRD